MKPATLTGLQMIFSDLPGGMYL